MEGDHSFGTLYFDSSSMPVVNEKGTMTYPSHPYQANELAVLFFYGTNFTRQMNIVFVPKSVQLCAGLIVLFVGLGSIVLCIVRRKLKLPRNSLLSSFIDTMVAFIAGGNLRMQHKFEKWNFAIMLIGAFFITSCFVGDFLACVYPKISTFEQLARINSPIYIADTLTMHSDNIREMLRLVLQYFTFEY